MELVARPANPQQSTETIDYKIASKYVENEHKDTKAADVEKVTFVPKLATFEMDVMQQMGIQVCSLTHNITRWSCVCSSLMMKNVESKGLMSIFHFFHFSDAIELKV